MLSNGNSTLFLVQSQQSHINSDLNSLFCGPPLASLGQFTHLPVAANCRRPPDGAAVRRPTSQKEWPKWEAILLAGAKVAMQIDGKFTNGPFVNWTQRKEEEGEEKIIDLYNELFPEWELAFGRFPLQWASENTEANWSERGSSFGSFGANLFLRAKERERALISRPQTAK